MASYTRNNLSSTPRPLVVSFSNQKGGVGKTTTTHHMADAGRRAGLRVLVIDADPQGNLTAGITQGRLSPDQVGLADVLSKQTQLPISEVVIPTGWEGVDLIPTVGEGLAVVSSELIVTATGRELKLRRALESYLSESDLDYDLVLIDCPPAIDQLMINALVASTHVVAVTQTRLFSMDGLARLVQNIGDVIEAYNQQLQIAGFLVNQFEKQLTTAQQRKRELVEAAAELGVPVMEPSIPKRTMIAETVEDGESLMDRGGEDATRLAGIYDSYLSKLMKVGA